MNTLYSHDQTSLQETGNSTRDCTMCGLNCSNGCGDNSAPSAPSTCYYTCEDVCKNACFTDCDDICVNTCIFACGKFCHQLVLVGM